MRTRLTAGLAAAAVLALPLLVTSPAFAAGPALPEGNHLYSMACDDDEETYGDLFSVDSVTAALTESATSDLGCVGSMAFDPTTGVSYAFNWDDGTLAPFVASTGYFGEQLPLTGGSNAPDGLAIGLDGAAFTTRSSTLYSLDLTTGVQTAIGDMGDSCIYAFSVDPTSGKFYGIECGSGTIYEVNTTTALLTSVGVVEPGGADAEQGINSLRIDTAGTWWIEAEPNEFAELYSFAGLAGASTPVLSGEFALSGTPVYTEAILMTWDPAPALAATGLDGFATFSLLGGGVLLLTAGGLVLLTARRTRNQY